MADMVFRIASVGHFRTELDTVLYWVERPGSANSGVSDRNNSIKSYLSEHRYGAGALVIMCDRKCRGPGLPRT